MQLRALIKTRRRKWAMIVLAVVVCAAAVWMLLDAGHTPTDEEKYRRMVRNRDWADRFYRLKWHFGLRTPLRVTLQRFEGRSSARCDRLIKELLASGYLVTFTVTNGEFGTLTIPNQFGLRLIGPCMLRVTSCLRPAGPMTWPFFVR
jgi:hypothetical protein